MVSQETISPDYLVVGAGAMGMAFVDNLLTETKSTTVAIVDRYHRPGGHWTTAYPFVRLHQPSAFYGVNSKHLGQDNIDEVGTNAGLHELATGDEVCAYYSQIMNQTFLPTGRVMYFPKHDYTGDGQFVSILGGATIRVGSKTRIVDSTYMRVTVPSMVPPKYEVKGVDLVTPNGLAKVARSYGCYTVVGAGKTGIDSCLWLLSLGIEPSRIQWIMPRDSWMFDRGGYQPGPLFADKRFTTFPLQGEAIMNATSVDDLMRRLESAGQLLRLSDEVWPTMFRCATVSPHELHEMKRIKNIVRKGRVQSISPDEVVLEGGSYKPEPDTLYIDCTADGLAKTEGMPVPVFNGNLITLQPIRFCQQVFSAALISHVESTYQDDQVKNDICRPIPHPNDAFDWLVIILLNNKNTLRWGAEPNITEWLSKSRLDWLGELVPPLPEDPQQLQQVLQAMVMQMQGLCGKLEGLIDGLPEKEAARARAQIDHHRSIAGVDSQH